MKLSNHLSILFITFKHVKNHKWPIHDTTISEYSSFDRVHKNA